MSPLDRTMCRLRAAKWVAQEAQATLDHVQAMNRGDMRRGRESGAWAEVCATRVQAWREEAEK
jgi:hypothetical protein